MPPRQPVIYVENNVGQGFVRAFNEFSKNHKWGAVFQNHVHPGMQRPQHGDVWWIREIASLGYALLTCDTKIVENAGERAAVIDSGLRYVGFASAQHDGWTQMRAITSHWDKLVDELDQDGPVVVKLYVSKAPEERP